jgi:hypothetical protein
MVVIALSYIAGKHFGSDLAEREIAAEQGQS